MSRSQMVNFRLREEDVPRLDAAAKQAGMSRSDFIREAVARLVASYTSDRKSPVEMRPADGRGPAVEKVRTPFPDCPRSSQCKIQKTTTGVKACLTCQARFA
mgnify:CR=1 FL=1|jgi:hypothetical protein